METTIISRGKKVVIGDERPTVLIGERINPSGKKRLSEALKQGDLDIVRREAIAQVESGADIIDVNVGTFGVDEVNLLPKVVKLVMETVGIPVCIDSSDPMAIEKAIEIYEGKPLINSVTGEEKSMTRILPLVRKHKTAVIGLLQDDKGIPGSVEGRLDIARNIIERAESISIPREDVIIDCLAIAVGADPEAALVSLETIKGVKAKLGVNVTLGASNVSFGMPDRELINNAFVATSILAGATCLIVDVTRVGPTVLATDLLIGRDKYARRYIGAYRKRSG